MAVVLTTDTDLGNSLARFAVFLSLLINNTLVEYFEDGLMLVNHSDLWIARASGAGQCHEYEASRGETV
jgi:hypothetical protein